jgi:hypothetical protein
MSVTDQQLLNDVQYALIEVPNSGASVSSQLWTLAEVIDAMNQAQEDFLKDTLLVLSRATLLTIPNTVRFDMPTDWIATVRVVWLNPDGVFSPLERADSFDVDGGNPTWPYNTEPHPWVYMETETPTLQLQTAPGGSDGGVLQLLYAAISAQLSNTGVAFSVPDDFTPYVKYRMLEILLRKLGRGQDTARADYCRGRYEEGVEIAKLIQRGWV